jgi:hypothetical protein
MGTWHSLIAEGLVRNKARSGFAGPRSAAEGGAKVN